MLYENICGNAIVQMTFGFILITICQVFVVKWKEHGILSHSEEAACCLYKDGECTEQILQSSSGQKHHVTMEYQSNIV